MRKIGDAKDTTYAVGDLRPRHVATKLDLDSPHDRSHGCDVEIGERPAQIADQQLDEPGTVASLQRQLLVVDDDGIHFIALAALAAQWPLRTALSIVAGNPVSTQSPARSNPLTAVVVAGRPGCPGASEKVARGSRTTVAFSTCAPA